MADGRSRISCSVDGARPAPSKLPNGRPAAAADGIVNREGLGNDQTNHLGRHGRNHGPPPPAGWHCSRRARRHRARSPPIGRPLRPPAAGRSMTGTSSGPMVRPPCSAPRHLRPTGHYGDRQGPLLRSPRGSAAPGSAASSTPRFSTSTPTPPAAPGSPSRSGMLAPTPHRRPRHRGHRAERVERHRLCHTRQQPRLGRAPRHAEWRRPFARVASVRAMRPSAPTPPMADAHRHGQRRRRPGKPLRGHVGYPNTTDAQKDGGVGFAIRGKAKISLPQEPWHLW